MTNLGDITGSLKDSIGMIKRVLGRVEQYDREAARYQKYANDYYNSYARSRYYSSRRRYIRYYYEYSDKARQARASKAVMTTEAKAMMRNFKGAMQRFEMLAKGRDANIANLKKKVAEQEVILTQAATTQAISETNVLITYAKSNFALLNGVISSIKKSASKDEQMLLATLKAMNDTSIKHTDRMLAVSENSIKILIDNAEKSEEINEFNQSSIISSLSTIGQAKTTVLLDGIEGKSGDIIHTGLVFVAAGIFARKLTNSVINRFSSKEEKKSIV